MENNDILKKKIIYDIDENYHIINRIEQDIIKVPIEKDNLRMWVRVAGISGCLAIMLAAYGAHGYYILILIFVSFNY